ncbi:hypothetical protein QG053_06325 [Kingella kingae]|nr:hypothetical protein [Kingella kingae]MDK4564659.1 hypothetical protein [Kingella kingae]MDK4574859.1 hypothetical protein [Kingella kingae]MDK4579042.1 hypothetical protein [Kingella kingae]MDK4606956.1 hypothetical protein [Kingella kingae]MDK4609100.1 hypothetical protein [Kingella kingae]
MNQQKVQAALLFTPPHAVQYLATSQTVPPMQGLSSKLIANIYK